MRLGFRGRTWELGLQWGRGGSFLSLCPSLISVKGKPWSSEAIPPKLDSIPQPQWARDPGGQRECRGRGACAAEPSDGQENKPGFLERCLTVSSALCQLIRGSGITVTFWPDQRECGRWGKSHVCQPQLLVRTGVWAPGRVLFVQFREKEGGRVEEKKEERLNESDTQREAERKWFTHKKKWNWSVTTQTMKGKLVYFVGGSISFSQTPVPATTILPLFHWENILPWCPSCPDLLGTSSLPGLP